MEELKWDGNTISNQKKYTEEELRESLEQCLGLSDNELPLNKFQAYTMKLDPINFKVHEQPNFMTTLHRNLQQGLDFYSKKFKKIIHTEIIERRRFTYKLRLENGKIIIKKKKQLNIPKDRFPIMLMTA